MPTTSQRNNKTHETKTELIIKKAGDIFNTIEI